MKKITEEECIELIKEKFPGCIPYFEEDEYCDIGFIMQMLPFANYIIDAIKSNNEVEKIFDFVEFLLCNGDQDVQNAPATGLLEDLMHQDPEKLNSRSFVKYLGKESTAYCRAWDEFTGAKTEGLWDEKWRCCILQLKWLKRRI